MNKSLKLRKEKAKSRMRLRRQLAKGAVSLEQISIAAACRSCTPERPLILRKVKVPEWELADQRHRMLVVP
jgi:hypothetical protein